MSQDIVDPQHRQIEDGFYWIQECLRLGEVKPLDLFESSEWHDPGNEIHGCQNAYLLEDEKSLLFDTLTQPNGNKVIELVDTFLEGDDLDYLVISHPEANHAGNTFTILQEYPEATLIAPRHGAGHGAGHGTEHELYHIARDTRETGSKQVPNPIEYVGAGDEIDLGKYTVTFQRPTFSDHSFTIWMTEKATDTLFTVDWMGFQHQDSDCLSYAGEFTHDVAPEQVYRFHALAFPWLQFADADKVVAAASTVMNEFSPEILAPAHGMPIIDDNPVAYVELFEEATRQLAKRGEPETIRSKLEYILPSSDEIAATTNGKPTSEIGSNISFEVEGELATRQLTKDVYWIGNCHPENHRHMHVSEYLIRGNSGTILIDSGSGLFKDRIIQETNRLTDGEGPDVVILAHSTLPHTENIPAFEEEWGSLKTIAATGRFPELVGLPSAEPRTFNRSVEFAGRTFTCIHPLLTDVTVSQWIFDHESRILFTAEAFGHYHSDGDCTATSTELDRGIDAAHIESFYRDKLPFLEFLDVEKLKGGFDALFDILDVAYVAPIHGNPVAAEDIDSYIEEVLRAVDLPEIESRP